MLSNYHRHAICKVGDGASLRSGHTGLQCRMRVTIPPECCWHRMKLHGVINQTTTIDIVVTTTTITINSSTLGLLRL
jgi:hypothetical protein